MVKPSDESKSLTRIAGDLSVPERVLSFRLASGTECAQAGVTGATETAMAMLVRGLIDRDGRRKAHADATGPRRARRAGEQARVRWPASTNRSNR
jgi:hypothetical protein